MTKLKLSYIFKILITAFVVLILFCLFIQLCSSKQMRTFTGKNIFISVEKKIVDSLYIEKVLILEHSELQPIKSNKKGYIIKDNIKNSIKDSLNIYYIVYENGDRMETSLEKFEQIHKGDVILFKTILIQK